MSFKKYAIAPAAAIIVAGGLAACMTSESDPAQSRAGSAKVETSSNGVFTKGEEVLVTPPGKGGAGLAKLGGSPYVGLIPKNTNSTEQPCPYAAWFYFDDQDYKDNNNQFFVGATDYSHRNYALGGIAHTSSPWVAGGNSRIQYCQEQMATLPKAKLDYAVISGSTTCPANGIRFARRWDNEDNSNNNKFGGEIDPNVVSSSSGGYSWINFCFVPKDPNATDLLPPSLADKYMLFAKGTPSYASFRTDDEDSNNNNQYTSTDGNYTARMQSLISGGSNTWMYLGWTGSQPVVADNGTAAGCGSEPSKPTCSSSPESSPNAACTLAWTNYNIKMAQYIGCMN